MYVYVYLYMYTYGCQVMGGKDSASFSYFRELCVQGFLEARKPEYSQVCLCLRACVYI